ncbi:outer membrane lipoprotein LolB [Lysobacter sp. K5869]|uniref:lipoprotein insertase outer membrane protein LolB n=1 Tax=Lysobacter sp. K5869 TaxID=2820808 RepID=UPI001C0633C0|nr:lipoprotein insertase outer membrane protein LolB [Lysobacter sp. K5869]QWP78872.1 outer membrane lipoprotein LolB [Lysobacter sp. K5869]
MSGALANGAAPGGFARARIAALAVLAALLTACAGAGVRPGAPTDRVVPAADAAEREAARVARVRAAAQWSLTGRIAVSNAGKGGSGRIEWNQRGGAYEVALSAPVTRQSWRLSGGPDGARLEGLDGGPRAGADAAELLFQATGWDIPVAALGDWLRGLPAGDGADARIARGPDGRPQSIVQGGWTIAYEWPASGDLPARLDARRDSARVRLIVDQWQGGAVAAAPAVRGAGFDALDPLRLQMLALNEGDPEADMRARVALGDRRPVGLGDGWGGTSLPNWGAPRWDGSHADLELGYPEAEPARVLRGSDTDVALDPALRARAVAYAATYNAALRWHLRAGEGAWASVEADFR